MIDNLSDYHPFVGEILKIFESKKIDVETFEHKEVRTSEEASKVRPGYTIDQGAKAIIARVKKPGNGKFFVMFVLKGGHKFSAPKIKEQFGLTDIRFANENEVSDITGGILPGGVPPFGNLFGLPIYADKELLKNKRIVFNAGDRRFSIGMKTEDYVNFVNPTAGDIAE